MTQLPFRKRWPALVIILLATLGGGALAGLLTRDSMSVYSQIVTPSFAPPGWLFPVAWSLLYAAMSISLWLMLRTDEFTRSIIVLYTVQLAVNLIWPFIFFTVQAFGLAFWWLILLLALVIWLMIRAFQVTPAAGWLLVPYAAWCTFAAVLNFAVARLNM